MRTIEFWIPALTAAGKTRKRDKLNKDGKVIKRSGEPYWVVFDWIGRHVTNQEPHSIEKQKEQAWYEHVRSAALKGLQESDMLGKLPLQGSKCMVQTMTTFAKRVHCDLENVHKGIVDALTHKQHVPNTDPYNGRPRKKYKVTTWMFDDDKLLEGHFMFGGYDKHSPGVRVRIIVRDGQ